MVSNVTDWRRVQLPPPSSLGSPSPTRAPLLENKPKRRRRWWLWALLICIVGGIALTIGLTAWYQGALQPRDSADTSEHRIQIAQGSTVAVISKQLEQEGMISSAFAMQLYAQITRVKNNLQAGTYILSPSQSVQTIVDHLVKGKVDNMMVTILPGATIKDIQKSLQKNYGFSSTEVEAAFAAKYTHPLLATRPKHATLEGYIYPETYQIQGDGTVQSLLKRSFDEMYTHLKEKKLLSAFKHHRLTIHQAITLASIIQKEVASEMDMKQVAQIFYKRLVDRMPLGADATFIYAADILGVEPRVSLDSPYNTRKVVGLPPGPIGNVSLSALEAVAHPAKGSYLYFVSGDDGKTYYSKTLKEHEQKTATYCRKNCAIFNN